MLEVLPVPTVQPLQQQAVEGVVTGSDSARVTGQHDSTKGTDSRAGFGTSEQDAATALEPTRVTFSIDHESGRMFIRVIDNATNEVIRQIPPEEFVRIADRLAKMIGILFDHRS